MAKLNMHHNNANDENVLNNKQSFPLVLVSGGVLAGVLISFIVYWIFIDTDNSLNNTVDEPVKPLYWVAPMDPNFKRDKPGKSPMGMDLIPVYAEDIANDSPGTVSIDPVTVQNLGVKTHTVTRSIPASNIVSVGQVQYAQDSIEHVHSRVEGWVENLYVRTVGDFVEEGEPIYAIYSPELVNAQEEYLIALSQNTPTLIKAAKARLKSLSVPVSLIENIEKTRTINQTVMIRSPITGFINELNIQQGFYVKPSVTMLSVASLDTVWVIADVFPSDANHLKIGQLANITSDAIPNNTFEATVDYIYPSLNDTTRTAQVRLIVDKGNTELSQMLKPEMFVRVSIDVSSDLNPILGVPKQAIIRTGKSDRVVLALEEGKYKSVNVLLGRDFDNVFEVLDGLKDGDEIVTSAQFLIDSESSITSDFMRMTPIENAMAPNISAWTKATVNEVMEDRNMINITHGALDAFDMMGMTMNFTLSDDIALSDFEAGMEIHIEVIREPSGMFQIKTVHFGDTESPDDDDSLTHDNHDHMEMDNLQMSGNEQKQKYLSAWTVATVNEIDLERRRVNLTHGYLEAFDMMGMTMDFTVSKEIDMALFVIGESVHVEIIREESGMFQVRTLHIMGSDKVDDSHDTKMKHKHHGEHE